jgi:hypothetical protein
MKTMIKMFSGLVFLVMIASCATTHLAVPEKYNLGNELEEVKEITKYTVTSWETVDTQSIILRANVNDYYLLVLDRPLIGLITSERIGVSSTVTSIKAGYDKIYVKDDTGTNYYTIDRIYKLKGRDQAKEIKERFRGK